MSERSVQLRERLECWRDVSGISVAPGLFSASTLRTTKIQKPSDRLAGLRCGTLQYSRRDGFPDANQTVVRASPGCRRQYRCSPEPGRNQRFPIPAHHCLASRSFFCGAAERPLPIVHGIVVGGGGKVCLELRVKSDPRVIEVLTKLAKEALGSWWLLPSPLPIQTALSVQPSGAVSSMDPAKSRTRNVRKATPLE